MYNPAVDTDFQATLRMSLQGLLWVKDSHTVSYVYSLLRNFQNILKSCGITALNGLNCLCVFLDMSAAQELERARQAESASCFAFPDKYRYRCQGIAQHSEKHNLNQFHN